MNKSLIHSFIQIQKVNLPVLNFINILWAAFAPIFFCQKIQSQIVNREKLQKALSYEKFASKMLMKLTIGNTLVRVEQHKLFTILNNDCKWLCKENDMVKCKIVYFLLVPFSVQSINFLKIKRHIGRGSKNVKYHLNVPPSQKKNY